MSIVDGRHGRYLRVRILLSGIVLLSLALKLYIIIKFGNRLTLSSDDLNYYKSAVVLIQRGILMYYGFNEPTVFITPLYPLFLAGVFKVAGVGFAGVQAVRVLQAFMGCLVIIIAYLMAKRLFDHRAGLVAAFLVAFYFPNSITPGYLLTETLFTFLLCLLLYLSLLFIQTPGVLRFALIGGVWAAATLCRPTIALYPLLLVFYLLLYGGWRCIRKLVLPGIAMASVFILIMAPWWIRNYIEYDAFIPLSAASGNPMLQGTYIGYKQEPGEVTYYKLGKNTVETNQNEVKTAVARLREGFRKDFWRYLAWYTLGKTGYFWGTIFYWKGFMGVTMYSVLAFHYLLLLSGISGMIQLALSPGFKRYLLPILVIVYFNMIHCVYMAFDRYAYPLLPLGSLFCAFFLVRLGEIVKYSFKR